MLAFAWTIGMLGHRCPQSLEAVCTCTCNDMPTLPWQPLSFGSLSHFGLKQEVQGPWRSAWQLQLG